MRNQQTQHPQRFLCPLTGQLMLDPVRAQDESIYERSAIEAWLRVGMQYSVVNAKLMLVDQELIPEHELQVEIQDYIEQTQEETMSDLSELNRVREKHEKLEQLLCEKTSLEESLELRIQEREQEVNGLNNKLSQCKVEGKNAKIIFEKTKLECQKSQVSLADKSTNFQALREQVNKTDEEKRTIENENLGLKNKLAQCRSVLKKARQDTQRLEVKLSQSGNTRRNPNIFSQYGNSPRATTRTFSAAPSQTTKMSTSYRRS